MEVKGYLRGKPLSVNGLIHIPGFGHFQMSKIVVHRDPYLLDKARKNEETMEDVISEFVADPAQQVIKIYLFIQTKKQKNTSLTNFYCNFSIRNR